ncbi:MAG: hypothetical protein H0T92_20905 [Pyrinomonadaceae bacterium]|nr:hypothetical protein [Pyrinomonadaceae bacterium]
MTTRIALNSSATSYPESERLNRVDEKLKSGAVWTFGLVSQGLFHLDR